MNQRMRLSDQTHDFVPGSFYCGVRPIRNTIARMKMNLVFERESRGFGEVEEEIGLDGMVIEKYDFKHSHAKEILV